MRAKVTIAFAGMTGALGYSLIVGSTVSDPTARFALAVVGSAVLTLITLAAIDAVDDEPPTAH